MLLKCLKCRLDSKMCHVFPHSIKNNTILKKSSSNAQNDGKGVIHVTDDQGLPQCVLHCFAFMSLNMKVFKRPTENMHWKTMPGVPIVWHQNKLNLLIPFPWTFWSVLYFTINPVKIMLVPQLQLLVLNTKWNKNQEMCSETCLDIWNSWSRTWYVLLSDT